MWIRFWHRGKCSSGINPEESIYRWYDSDIDPKYLTEKALEAEADDWVPEWQKASERGYRYGFEILQDLPPDVREKMVKETRYRIESSVAMLRLLLTGAK